MLGCNFRGKQDSRRGLVRDGGRPRSKDRPGGWSWSSSRERPRDWNQNWSKEELHDWSRSRNGEQSQDWNQSCSREQPHDWSQSGSGGQLRDWSQIRSGEQLCDWSQNWSKEELHDWSRSRNGEQSQDWNQSCSREQPHDWSQSGSGGQLRDWNQNKSGEQLCDWSQNRSGEQLCDWSQSRSEEQLCDWSQSRSEEQLCDWSQSRSEERSQDWNQSRSGKQPLAWSQSRSGEQPRDWKRSGSREQPHDWSQSRSMERPLGSSWSRSRSRSKERWWGQNQSRDVKRPVGGRRTSRTLGSTGSTSWDRRGMLKLSLSCDKEYSRNSGRDLRSSSKERRKTSSSIRNKQVGGASRRTVENTEDTWFCLNMEEMVTLDEVTEDNVVRKGQEGSCLVVHRMQQQEIRSVKRQTEDKKDLDTQRDVGAKNYSTRRHTGIKLESDENTVATETKKGLGTKSMDNSDGGTKKYAEFSNNELSDKRRSVSNERNSNTDKDVGLDLDSDAKSDVESKSNSDRNHQTPDNNHHEREETPAICIATEEVSGVGRISVENMEETWFPLNMEDMVTLDEVTEDEVTQLGREIACQPVKGNAQGKGRKHLTRNKDQQQEKTTPITMAGEGTAAEKVQLEREEAEMEVMVGQQGTSVQPQSSMDTDPATETSMTENEGAPNEVMMVGRQPCSIKGGDREAVDEHMGKQRVINPIEALTAEMEKQESSLGEATRGEAPSRRRGTRGGRRGRCGRHSQSGTPTRTRRTAEKVKEEGRQDGEHEAAKEETQTATEGTASMGVIVGMKSNRATPDRRADEQGDLTPASSKITKEFPCGLASNEEEVDRQPGYRGAKRGQCRSGRPQRVTQKRTLGSEQCEEESTAKEDMKPLKEDTKLATKDITQLERATTQPGGGTNQPQEVTKQPEKVTKQPEDVTMQSEEVTTQPEVVATQSEEVKEQPEKVMTQPEEVTKQLEEDKMSEEERMPDEDAKASEGEPSASDAGLVESEEKPGAEESQCNLQPSQTRVEALSSERQKTRSAQVEEEPPAEESHVQAEGKWTRDDVASSERQPPGWEYVIRGFYCKLCNVLYTNASVAKIKHCSSAQHHLNYQKRVEKKRESKSCKTHGEAK